MSYSIYIQRGTGAYATAQTLDEAVRLAAESHKEQGRHVWILSDDPGEGIDGEIMCHDGGTRINPEYIPYTREEHDEVRRSRERAAEAAQREKEEDEGLRAEIRRQHG